MQANGWKFFFAALLAVMGSPAVAGAEETAPGSEPLSTPVQAFPWFVGLGLGAGYATISHPQIVTGGAPVTVLTLHGGYTLGDHLMVGLELSGSDTTVGRDTTAEPFKVGYAPQMKKQRSHCSRCAWDSGADVKSTSLVFSSLGARVEYTPFGRDGLFVSGMAGLGLQIGLGGEAGFGFGGRVGYRYRATGNFTVSIEAGMTGQLYGDSTMYMPFGVLVVRPYFLGGVQPPGARPRPPR